MGKKASRTPVVKDRELVKGPETMDRAALKSMLGTLQYRADATKNKSQKWLVEAQAGLQVSDSGAALRRCLLTGQEAS